MLKKVNRKDEELAKVTIIAMIISIFRPSEQLFESKLSKKLEFGYTNVSSYKKHTG